MTLTLTFVSFKKMEWRNFDPFIYRQVDSTDFLHFDSVLDFQARMLELIFIWIVVDVAIPFSVNA